MKELTVARAHFGSSLQFPITDIVAASVHQLYAFFYSPNPPVDNGGWNIYSPREEFGRMGVGTRTKAWRFTDINKDYSVRSSFNPDVARIGNPLDF